MQPQKFDVIISGAGMVGLTLARALLQGGINVALLEAQPRPQSTAVTEIDPRVFALTRASEWIFRNLGVWEGILKQRIGTFREMRVWNQSGAIHFDSAQLGEAYLGHIAELQVIRNALLEGLDADLTWYSETQITTLHLEDNAIHVNLDNGQQLSAGLLVGADGAESRVRTLSRIHCAIRDYAHHALVATVRTELPHAETAWQHFLVDGPLAFLPLHEAHTSSIVWSTTPHRAADLLAMDDAEFAQHLAHAFDLRLGEVLHCEARAVFPLYRRHAEHYVQPRIALIGDAAHTIHPLAGQGVNLGLLDAACLAEECLTARNKHRDVGSYALLRRYERRRRGDNQTMLWLMDGLKHLFTSRLPGVAQLRNFGLNLTDAVMPAKDFFMRRAMVLESADLPKLARPYFPAPPL